MKNNIFLQLVKCILGKKIESIGLVVAVLLLAGCSHHRSEQVYFHKKTLTEIRQDYVDLLKTENVQVIEIGETIRIIIPSDQLFHADSANLHLNYAESVLPIAADLIHTYDTVSIDVDAYSDNNYGLHQPHLRKWAMTKRQAEIVANQLWTKGINTRLMVARGHGSNFPVALPNSIHGQADNRRVEIFFYYYPKFNRYD